MPAPVPASRIPPTAVGAFVAIPTSARPTVVMAPPMTMNVRGLK